MSVRARRVVVTGAGGQLGRELVTALTARGHTPLGSTRAELDLLERSAVSAAVRDLRPDVVVNCAAWTAVDACETDPERAHRVNTEAVGWLADACADVGSRLVQISTEYVFDGRLHRAYRVDDQPNPLNVYGASKLAGEAAALGLGDRALVVRTSWLFSRHPGNMAVTVASLLRDRQRGGPPLRFVDDQVGCPTYAPDLAAALVELIDVGAAGITHATNQSAMSWFDFARALVTRLDGNSADVLPISTTELDPPRPAARPRNSVLDGSSLITAGIEPLREVQAALDELVADPKFGPGM